MTLFGEKLTEIESKLTENSVKTKGVFPEETQAIERGLELMTRLTEILNTNVDAIWKKPNLVTNINLFARNRQLLLNAYACGLNSSYGTQFVILRTVQENNNLMRHFDKKPKDAFSWLSLEMQGRFPEDVRKKYAGSGHDGEFRPSDVMNDIFDGKIKVKQEVKNLYKDFCNYTHPNFKGWQELFGTSSTGQELILKRPTFQSNNAEMSIGLLLYEMQVTFKSFVETFKEYIAGFTTELTQWQEKYLSLIPRYSG